MLINLHKEIKGGDYLNNNQNRKDVPYIAVGIAMGVAFGVALDNVGIGIAIGLAIGVALDAKKSKKNKK